MPEEIFELLFSEHTQKHIMKETVKYAQVCHNDFTINMTECELRCYVRTWFMFVYRCLSLVATCSLGEEQ